jgi:hypothetical protein
MPAMKATRPPLWKQLAWFVALWIAGVAAVGSVAFVIRSWLN